MKMKSRQLLAALALCRASVAIWPIPVEYKLGESSLFIDPDVKFFWSSSNTNSTHLLQASEAAPANQVIKTAIQTARKTLFQYGFVPWKFHPRNSHYEPDPEDTECIHSITLHLSGEDPPNLLRPVIGSVDESYVVQIDIDGAAVITAKTSVGIAHGLTSFTQLFFKHSNGQIYTPYAPLSVQDRPLFPYRGLNLDVARAWFPVDDIFRTIDALAYAKMNHLHLHVTDAQSWPLVIPSMPELAKAGAYCPTCVYSPADIDRIQSYGASRGINVFLEIDMPGHTSSIWHSHPDLIASFNVQPGWSAVANEPPSGSLKLNKAEVSLFIERLFNDLLPRLSRHTPYFHSGGDEINANSYLGDESVQSNDTTVLRPLLQKFIDHAHKIVRDNNMTPIVWEEMLINWELDLGSDVIVQSWQSEEVVAAIVKKGFKALVGNYNSWYLDCGQGQWVNAITPNQTSQYLDYCNPRKNWRVVYSVDPLKGIPTNQTHLVLGGEVHAWAEQIDPVNLDRQVWPRAAAAGEVLWSGANDADGKPRSLRDAALRLSDFRERLVHMGINAELIQMPFCTMEPDQCNI